MWFPTTFVCIPDSETMACKNGVFLTGNTCPKLLQRFYISRFQNRFLNIINCCYERGWCWWLDPFKFLKPFFSDPEGGNRALTFQHIFSSSFTFPLLSSRKKKSRNRSFRLARTKNKRDTSIVKARTMGHGRAKVKIRARFNNTPKIVSSPAEKTWSFSLSQPHPCASNFKTHYHYRH